MDRIAFHKLFKTPGPAVFPVIHVRDGEQALRNVALALTEGVQGIFLINHDFPHQDLLPIIERVRQRFSSLWLGVNFLGVTGREAFPLLGDLARRGTPVDAYWADNACIDERRDDQPEAEAIQRARVSSAWDGLYFGGTAFKKQRRVDPGDFQRAAETASRHMDAVTTSGIATGQAAESAKIEAFRRGCGDSVLAVASGVTPDNVQIYAGLVDAILVATGINAVGDFYNIDPRRLGALLARARRAGFGTLPDSHAKTENDRDQRWYLALMAPNVKGERFAWLDPSAIYVNARAFHALLDDLVEPFRPEEIDVVAGPDAMGFVLGTGLATRLGRGFLTIRKAGKIPVEADQVQFVNYTGRSQLLEMRRPAIRPGTRVLLVDQWIETGGTMAGAIDLVKRQGGEIAGIATVCIEESEQTANLRRDYRCSTAVLPGTPLQAQCNRKALDSFRTYDPTTILPDLAPQSD